MKRNDPGVSARAVCLGLFLSALVCLATGYNDWVLHNTLLVGNHFPYVSIVAVAALVLTVNAAARRWSGTAGLSGGELMLIWGMIGVAGGIAGSGLMRYLPSWLAVPAYYATAASGVLYLASQTHLYAIGGR